MKNEKDIVAGLGEIGMPIFKLFSRSGVVVGYDTNQSLMNVKQFELHSSMNTRLLHICIPFSNQFVTQVVSLYRKFLPKCGYNSQHSKPIHDKEITGEGRHTSNM